MTTHGSASHIYRRCCCCCCRCVADNGCVPPPKKRRGMGSSVMALVTSLARGNPREGGLTGDRVCFRCRAVVQVALAAMEAHQRTSALAGSSWAETVASERVQRQELRDGGTADVVMDQLHDTLQAMSKALAAPADPSDSASAGGGGIAAGRSVRDALLLALRGVSLSGGSIGAREASAFRRAWVSYMMAGGFRDAGSGVPKGIAEGLERLRLRREAAGLGGVVGAMGEEGEEAGLRLELEDIARERTQRLREAASSRCHLQSGVLRDLAHQPYTFVASASSGSGQNEANAAGDSDGGGGGDGVEDGWDDWGDEDGDEASGGVDGGDASSAIEHATECDTLVGRLAGLVLDRTNPEVPDLHEAKLMSAASVGLGLLSSGLKTFARMGAGAARRNRKKSRPNDRPVVVIFVVGGFTPLELAEVNGVVRCAAAAAGGLDTEVILGGTTICTPDILYEQVLKRLPAGQT